MPEAWEGRLNRVRTGRLRATVLLGLCSLVACRGESVPHPTSDEAQSQATGPATAVAVATYTPHVPPGAPLGCEHVRPKALSPKQVETVLPRLPKVEEELYLSKTGVIVHFSREDFFTVARCLNFQQAIQYLEEQTGGPEAPVRDAFQLSYVAAALLDLGRVSVRVREEKEPRPSFVRSHWSSEGCGGRCRSLGRIYRLTESDPLFFLRVTDKTEDTPN